MRTDEFDYALPARFIAQHPANPRDSSRLMVLNRRTSEHRHLVFRDLPGLLNRGDALVINQTRVRPARLDARKVPTGGRVELLLLHKVKDAQWEVFVGGHRVGPGTSLALEGDVTAHVLEDLGGPRRLVQFEGSLDGAIEQSGRMPLPPYIKEPLRDRSEYQTVFAERPGSAAAPTAGLHFTTGLLEEIEGAGVQLVRVTLHIGADTFAPVQVADPSYHPIHSEWCQVTRSAAAVLNRVRADGGRIIAVGTTSVRTLETAAKTSAGDPIAPFEGPTDLYILPGFKFRAVDAILTNFHLPRSTLLMLVSAFAGRQRIMDAYREAQEQEYRFYSFGDAMFIA